MSQPDWNTVFQPVTSLFTSSQIQMLLLAWLPLKFGGFFQTGIYAVDMFLVTVVASLITALLSALHASSDIIKSWFKRGDKSLITLQIDYYRPGPWGDDIRNKYYSAASWMVSNANSGLDSGSFIVVPEAEYDNNDEDIVDFDILPQKATSCEILYKDNLYDVYFQDQQQQQGEGERNKKTAPPSIVITPRETQSVGWCKEFLKDLAEAYLQHEKSKQKRSRYELTENGDWFRVLELHPNLGLKSVALDEEQEHSLKHDLDTFIADREFYAQIGMPYRRGYLFFGKPGTGKTSLIQAMASELERDIYYMNLKCIKSDSSLQSAFSRVPHDSVIVFEDIDAMSKVVHQRSKKTSLLDLLMSSDAGGSGNVVGPKPEGDDEPLKAMATTAGGIGSSFGSLGPFTLSCLLNCLDGHVMESGNIVIMTTNHPEVLDPALVRAGRIDLQLDLGYCTRYQVNRMYNNVVRCDLDAESAKRPELDKEWLEQEFIEGVVPPCEVMRVMMLHRRKYTEIPQKLKELVKKFQSGAKSAEEEEEIRRRLEMAALEEKEAKDEEGGDSSSDEDDEGEEEEEEESGEKKEKKANKKKEEEVKVKEGEGGETTEVDLVEDEEGVDEEEEVSEECITPVETEDTTGEEEAVVTAVPTKRRERSTSATMSRVIAIAAAATKEALESAPTSPKIQVEA